jgi:folate-binding protein YgfZ
MTSYFHFPNACIFLIHGQDASRYLNARLTNKVPSLEAGKGFWAAGLTPQGRTEFLGFLIKRAEQEYVFVCDAGEIEVIESALLRYKVADRLQCENLSSSFSLFHVFSQGEIPLEVLEKEFEHVDIVQNQRGRFSGVDVLIPSPEIRKFQHFCDSQSFVAFSEDAMCAERILSMHPSFPSEWNSRLSFLEHNFRSAVSFDKGCYAGQEVVEKMDSIGKAPKLLRRIKSQHLHLLGKKLLTVTHDGHVVGEALSFVPHPGDESLCISFAILKNNDSLLKETLYIEGSQVSIF